MPIRGAEKCRLCSKLSFEQMLLRHGTEGDGCFEGEPCHKRRAYYRHRDKYNRDRRLKYQAQRESLTQIQGIPLPELPAVVVHFYRSRKDAPLHALRVGLWMGQRPKEMLPALHTLGWTEKQVKDYLHQAIAAFSQRHEVKVSRIAAMVELDPQQCPLTPCPLKLDIE